jgi:hypothetical protein
MNKGILCVRNSTSDFRSLSRRVMPGSSGVEDIFGWSETQVQRNIVDKQLQIMFHSVRVWVGSPQPDGSRLSIDDMGIASPKLLWVIAYRSNSESMGIYRLQNGEGGKVEGEGLSAERASLKYPFAMVTGLTEIPPQLNLPTEHSARDTTI